MVILDIYQWFQKYQSKFSVWSFRGHSSYIAAVFGFINSKNWGWFKSAMGKATLFYLLD